jgi:ABC-type transporter Mla subunit MlaD
MPNATTAEIIPFPGCCVTVPPSATDPAPDGQVRLSQALASLDKAISEQRVAMGTWRAALDELRKTTQGLGLSMQRYRGSLDRLGAEVATLNDQATRLERWADDALAGEG